MRDRNASFEKCRYMKTELYAHNNCMCGFSKISVGIVITCVTIALTVALTAGLRIPASTEVTAWTAISVSEHGTLWDLAEAHPIDGLSTSATIHVITEKNQLSSTALYPGQTVLVPKTETPSVTLAER